MRQLLIATRNSGKIKEIKQIFNNLFAGKLCIPFELKTLKDVGIVDEIEEFGESFEENAILKSKAYGQKSGLLTLAEDSGLEIDALHGRPGIYSARYAPGEDRDRNDAVIRELRGVPREKRTAQYRAVAALFDPISQKITTFEGVSRGYITERPIGENGFGYDPIFFNFDLNKTNGQATAKEKNSISHRARVLEKVKKLLISLQ